MNKRFISLILCLVLLTGMVIPAYAAGEDFSDETAVTVLNINTWEEFLNFAENCRLDTYSVNLAVFLKNDIDLSDCEFSGIPIFNGSFDGSSHKITGLNLTSDGSMQGLFRNLTATAVVRNLSVSGSVHSGGSRSEVGAIAGRNEGKILNCSFSGTISGGDYVGGIAGSNGITGIIETCFVYGEIHGNHFVGGTAGGNSGVIRSCFNHAAVNTTPQQNTVEITDITVDTLTNTEASNTVTDIGGIAGISSGVIRNCKNHADVGYRHMGYNIGGIAGTQSGYIAGCENHGNVHGRKEIGGIVGQMEPAAVIEYTEDAIQILQGQLDTMSALVNQAAGNAQGNAGEITGQLGILHEQTQTAIDAVETLFPSEDNPEPPDPDAVLAAQNTLTATLNAMPGTLNSISDATQTTVYSLAHDLNAISGQIDVMGQTLSSAPENLGGTVSDVSDNDTGELLSGKVERCRNYGEVLADINAGGIAGAVAAENDLDVLEDWKQNGEESMNFSSEVRAVILSCENYGRITGKKQNAGGIAGWQSLGLVKNCANTGAVDSSNGSFVGGVSGLSTGFIRSSYAKCELFGKENIGGIAGSATIASDCLSQVRLNGGKEKQGAILGSAGKNLSDEELPVVGNYYLCVDEDFGAIDGISYSGLAEPAELDSFMSTENLPELFRTVTVRFVFDNGRTTEVLLAPGENLSEELIPAIPEKDGFTGTWDGLESAKLTNILFDMTFDTVYKSHSTTIQSSQRGENGLPLVLAEGDFSGGAVVSAAKAEQTPAIDEHNILLAAWDIFLSEPGDIVRFLSPVDADAEHLKMLHLNSAGSWSEISFTRDGSYLVFAPMQNDMTIALVESSSPISVLAYGAVAASGLLLIAAAVLIHRRRKIFSECSENKEISGD